MNNDSNLYSYQFFNHRYQGSLDTAKVIIPLLVDLLSPKSVVDIGCADGIWLAEFQNHGINDILGLDGDYIPETLLKIDKSSFLQCNLESPPRIDKHFDLAICLEVAEHLSNNISESFIEFLVNLSDVVLFSSAIPYQTGTNHINLHWQQYWADIFYSRGYLPITTIRAAIWDNPIIPFWYKQNIALYVKNSTIEANTRLKRMYEISEYIPLSIVHPEYYILIASYWEEARKETEKSIIPAFFYRIRKQIDYLTNRKHK